VSDRQLAQRLFPYQDPLTESMQDRTPSTYRVVGLVREKEEKNMRRHRTQAGKMGGRRNTSTTIVYIIALEPARSRLIRADVVNPPDRRQHRNGKSQCIKLTIQAEGVAAVAAATGDQASAGRFHRKLDYESIVPLQLRRQGRANQGIFNIVWVDRPRSRCWSGGLASGNSLWRR
jgi:hypothetical protein